MKIPVAIKSNAIYKHYRNIRKGVQWITLIIHISPISLSINLTATVTSVNWSRTAWTRENKWRFNCVKAIAEFSLPWKRSAAFLWLPLKLTVDANFPASETVVSLFGSPTRIYTNDCSQSITCNGSMKVLQVGGIDWLTNLHASKNSLESAIHEPQI